MMADYQVWSLWIAGMAAVAGIATGIFVGLQVRQAAKNTKQATEARQKEWELRRRESSMQFYMATLESRDARKTRLPPDRDAAGIARLIEESKSDTAKLDTIRSHLSYYEMLATGVNTGVLDEDIVNRFGGGPVVAAWQNYRTWVEERRVEFNAPTMFTELEMLASRIADRRG
jgi:Domain of unknown function (DUF4760)